MTNHTNTTAPTSAPSASPNVTKTPLQCKQTNVDGWNVASLAGAGFPQRSVCEESDFVLDTTVLFPYFEQTTDPCYSETHSCFSASFNYSGSETPFFLAAGCVKDANFALAKFNVASGCLSIEACKNFNQNGTGKPAGGFETCKTNDCNNCTDFGAAGVVGPSLLLFATMVGGLASFFSF